MFTVYQRLAITLFVLFTGSAHADLAIISHADYAGGALDKYSLKKLFLGKRQAFPNGHKAYTVQHAPGSPDRKEFFDSVLGMNESSYAHHWNRMTATGSRNSPEELHNYAALLRWVAQTPGSISYINSNLVDDSVKVLLTIKDYPY